MAPVCPAAIDPLEGETVSHAPPEVVVADAAQFRVPAPPFVTTNVCVVGVELVAVRLKLTEVADKAITGAAAGCTWRMRRLAPSAIYRLPAESSASPYPPASDAAVAGPPSPEKP